MQLDAQAFLDLCEASKKICFFDIEATGLHGDYNSVLVVAVKPYRQAPVVRSVEKPGKDFQLVEWAVKELGKYACWVSYYGKGFDIKMLRTRLVDGGARYDLPKKHHIDLYYSVAATKIKTSRRSQGHLLSWLYREDKEETKRGQKMTVPAGVWNAVLNEDTRARALSTLRKRCASDTVGLQALYTNTRHLISDVQR